MRQHVIALDIGTSGFRAHCINLLSHEIISTCITTHHPLPGSNTIDHLHFALEYGVERANRSMISAINKLIKNLGVPISSIERLAICGNPIQLSIFQSGEIRDLAYSGSRKLELMHIENQKRDARMAYASDFPDLCLKKQCSVVIPPAVCHQVGADALALIMQTEMRDKKEVSLAIDFGTNAEMVLMYNNITYTASTAAGPAIEGQHISCGMLAGPGAISDISTTKAGHQLIVLDAEMKPCNGPVVRIDHETGFHSEGVLPTGITGTGTMAAIHEAIEAGFIVLPKIQTEDRALHFGEKIVFTEVDLQEAGKAFGAIRAGYITLCNEAGINIDDIQNVYMAGASGTYADASKAQKLGLIPPSVKNIYQVGNTSLTMAKELAIYPEILEEMKILAAELRQSHCMLASSEIFKKVYILEISYWTEGMPMQKYRDFLKIYKYCDLPPISPSSTIYKVVERDIKEFGRNGLTLISDFGQIKKLKIEACTLCMMCVKHCPQKAISIVSKNTPPSIRIDESICEGVTCRKCERICPEKVFELDKFFS